MTRRLHPLVLLLLPAALAMPVGARPAAPIAAPLAQAAPPPSELATLIQAHYGQVASFTADFTHAYKGGLLPQVSVERGQVKIKKPGRMRWVYQPPDPKEIVADGRMLYSYIKADRVCYVSDIPQGDQASTAILFLSGKGDLARDFTPSAAPAASGEWRLTLTPHKKQQDFTELIIGVEPTTLKMRTLETRDADGGVSTFTFTNLRENAPLSDKDFLFSIPKGVDVIR